MIKKIFFIFISELFAQNIFAQTLPISVLPKNVKTILSNFIYVPKGTFTQGLHEMGIDSLQWHPVREVTVKSYYMNRFETTVTEYSQFHTATNSNLDLPDSILWTSEFPYSYNQGLIDNYFSHPMYAQYPINCITWEQAVRYCQWKTKEINALLTSSNYRVEIRLPTEDEWERAALPTFKATIKNNPKPVFPWGSSFWISSKQGKFSFACNSGVITTRSGLIICNYFDDGNMYTAPVQMYSPNELGLYQMAGNVREWTSDFYRIDTLELNKRLTAMLKESPNLMNTPDYKSYMPAFPTNRYDDFKIVKGGSWYDDPFYQQCGIRKIHHPQKASATIGFRVVCIVRKRN